MELFINLTGIGFLICVSTGLFCAVCGHIPPGPLGSSFCDPANLRLHWRGAVKVGLTMMGVGVVGQLAFGLLS